VSHWLLSCKGCGCSYLVGEKSNGDFCQFCCRDIKESPSTFKTLAQRNLEKGLALAAEINSGKRRRR
jgi:hypothetical protein